MGRAAAGHGIYQVKALETAGKGKHQIDKNDIPHHRGDNSEKDASFSRPLKLGGLDNRMGDALQVRKKYYPKRLVCCQSNTTIIGTMAKPLFSTILIMYSRFPVRARIIAVKIPKLGDNHRRTGDGKKDQGLKEIGLLNHFAVQHIGKQQTQRNLTEYGHQHNHDVVADADKKHRIGKHPDIVVQAGKPHFAVPLPLGKPQNKTEAQGKNEHTDKNDKSGQNETVITYLF
jgi:hypothetical protein